MEETAELLVVGPEEAVEIAEFEIQLAALQFVAAVARHIEWEFVAQAECRIVQVGRRARELRNL
jgi:hypothetical protein